MSDRTLRLKRIAAFAAGVTAWEAVVHGSLLVNRSSPSLFGIRLIPRLNLIQTVIPAVTSVALARYAFATKPRAPVELRIAARWALSGAGLPVGRVLDAADRHYAGVAPRIRAATAPGRLNLRMAAYVLSLRRALREEGMAETGSFELLSSGLFRVMWLLWRVPDALVRVRHPRDRVARVRARERLSRRFLFRDPDWAISEVPVPHGDGFDITRCVMRDFLAAEGEAQLCLDVLCRQDELMAAARGDRLTRTATLAGGADRCDFRFS